MPLACAAISVGLAATAGYAPWWLVPVVLLVGGVAAMLWSEEDREQMASNGAAARGGDPVSAHLFDALPDPAILLRPGGVVVRANRAAHEAIRGLSLDQPISFALRVPELLEAIREVAAGAKARSVEYADRVPVERWTHARVSSFGTTNGTPEFVLLVLSDLTPLRQAERMRVDFIANASHELRTPLAALLGFVETLQGPARNDPDARARFLDIMRGQANRMSRLVDDLLSLSRIEQKQHMRPVTPVDLVEVVKAVLDGLAPVAGERAVELRPDLPAGSVMVRGDRDELIRVAENLVENAIKYGQSGGRVDVLIALAGRQVRLSVRDHGPGISPEHLPRLTERFYRIDIGQSREKGGTGLGLAIVKHIMARHRGRLLIESDGPGQGATFTAVLDRMTDENGDTHMTVSADVAAASSARHMAEVEPTGNGQAR